MTELDPQTFDVDAWLTGAKLPEHSVKVYARADLLAKADELQREIAVMERVADDERAIGEKSASTLREEYERLADEFEASALTITVRALPDTVSAEIQQRADAKELDPIAQKLEEIHAALVSPRMTIDQLRAMYERIGPAQTVKVWNAVWRATGEQPEVSPAFLPRRSGQDAGRE